MKLFSLFLVFTGIAAQNAAAEAESSVYFEERANLDGEEKAPRDCGQVRVVDKGNLRFSCKQKRGKGIKNTNLNGQQNMGNMKVTKKCKSKFFAFLFKSLVS